ncbi:MAG TPA: molybdate ABC transporter substrate-binding protein [Burkholderiaceae bacterium]|nr:molybdate ABC transporter substrate-binding protein [Burkholderiaceae bacterium]
MVFRLLVAAGLAAALTLAVPAPSRAQEITVFAAASLQNALEEIGAAYRQRTGHGAIFSFAASSALARQIEQGAPAAIFASADEQWMDYLQQRNLIVDATRKPLLGNSLVLVVPAGNTAQIELKPGFDFARVLGADGRWVTGDPSNVPVGRYAEEALKNLGTWDFAQTRLVRAENVRVALAFVERGEAAAGIVYSTDAALSQKVRVAGVFPATSHKPVTYPVALVARHDTPAAREFLAFLESDESKAIFRKFGFVVH